MTSEVPPTAIGPYRLLGPLGQGGMGIVYRARHRSSEKAVALKTVKIETRRWLDGIRREIDALTQIRHPGVVRIHDHGVHEGRPWYAMDLLEGESLGRFGQRLWSRYVPDHGGLRNTRDPIEKTDDLSPLSGSCAGSDAGATRTLQMGDTGLPPAAAGELRTVIQLMRRVFATLAFLHGEGFVNRDLKADNILLVDGQPVLIDFGLMAHQPGGSGREAMHSVPSTSGTLLYMSPEQIRGELVDARGDLYSAGCILYELVTGRLPFTGSAPVVQAGHLSSPPIPPSQLVAGIPPDLEHVMMKLLEKEQSNRVGFADEVADVLGALSGEVGQLPGFPRPQPYLYRPRLVGRGEILTRLVALRERAILGSGTLLLLGGESGVGKTRLAMELTRLESARIRVVTSEASAPLYQTGGGPDGGPLHALRPLLKAVADRCQEGGYDATERLLGERRAVLASYEPLLAEVPSNDPLSPVIPLPMEAARQRLFEYLATTIQVLSRDRPLLWVLDDLNWADELSVSFLNTLGDEYLESTALLIIATYRCEETTEAIARLAAQPHVRHQILARLSDIAVSSMIADMLASTDQRAEFVDFVTRHAEGNPFFVTEHVRAAVIERVIYRDRANTWQHRLWSERDHVPYDAIGVPRSLRELLDHRLRVLTSGSQQLAIAAAVIGRESEIMMLRDVTNLSDAAAQRAVDELLRRQVFEQAEPGRIRFTHDKLREVAYGRAPADVLTALHERVALALEAQCTDITNPSQPWATMGRHFVAGRKPLAAARCLELAARHARTRYANADAVLLYREALAQMESVEPAEDHRPPQLPDEVDAREALGDVLAIVGQRDEARREYKTALDHGASLSVVQRGRLNRKLGKTWEAEHAHDRAATLYDLASSILGDAPSADAPQLEEWISVHLDRLWVHYWLGQVSAMDELIGKLRPIIDSHGSAEQRVRFLQSRFHLNLRRHRYVVNEETLSFARTALAALDGAPAHSQLLMATFNHAFALMLHQSLDAADAELAAALDLARRAGDAPQQVRCIAYLALVSRMKGRVTETEQFAEAGAAAAEAAKMSDYVALCRANESWVELRRGSFAAARALAERALDIWRSLPLVFSFQWAALLPLLRLELSRGHLDAAVACAQGLLSPEQIPLPGGVADALSLASRYWQEQSPNRTRKALEFALRSLEGTVHQ